MHRGPYGKYKSNVSKEVLLSTIHMCHNFAERTFPFLEFEREVLPPSSGLQSREDGGEGRPAVRRRRGVAAQHTWAHAHRCMPSLGSAVACSGPPTYGRRNAAAAANCAVGASSGTCPASCEGGSWPRRSPGLSQPRAAAVQLQPVEAAAAGAG